MACTAPQALWAQENHPAGTMNEAMAGDSTDMRFGLYIDNISNIDYAHHTYNVVFYVWNNTIGEFVDLESDLDVLNTLKKDVLYREKDSIWVDGVCYYSHLIKFNCTILNALNLNMFPFDENALHIDMELLSHNSGERTILLDQKNSRLKPDFIKDWQVYDAEFKTSANSWNSNFGDFSAAEQPVFEDRFKTLSSDEIPQFDTLHAVVHLRRDAWGIYFKLFFVLFLSMIMAASSVFLPNNKSEEKISIIVGSLFAAIGNKYITDSVIPLADAFGLSDIIHLLTIFGLLVLVFYAIYEQRRQLADSLRSDLIIFTATLLGYTLAVAGFTYFFSHTS